MSILAGRGKARETPSTWTKREQVSIFPAPTLSAREGGAVKPVVWGVLGTSRIGVDKVVPAMQRSPLCDIHAIASRDAPKARATAGRLGIARAYDSYEALLADPDIEAIYNPLPNHMHIEWSMRALEAGKHVLCEKPIALNAEGVAPLIETRDRTGLVVEEAFMVRDHPQWRRVRELLDAGRVGELRTVQIAYTYHNIDPDDIRNKPETGGGGLYDIGCYACAIARLIFDDEPLRAMALIDRDPIFGTDRLASAVLEFGKGHASFCCSTQSGRYQMVQILGSSGWIRVEVPFAHPPTLAARLVIGIDNEPPGTEAAEVLTLEPVNQYLLQGERFSRRVRGEEVPAWPLENAVANMRIIDALYRSGESGQWETVGA